MRDLVPDDRVKIIGPWSTDSVLGHQYIGKLATVRGLWMGTGTRFKLEIDGVVEFLWWCRENLRALPRRK